MAMKYLIEEVKKRIPGLTNYAIARDLRKLGIEVTTPAIDNYSKGVTRCRFDVLMGLKELGGIDNDRFVALLQKDVTRLRGK